MNIAYSIRRRLRHKPAPLYRPPNLAAGQPQWETILAQDAACWQAARQAAQQGPRVLIATSVGGHASNTIVESLLAVALTLRGARVHVLLCDQFLPGCQLASVHPLKQAEDFVSLGPAVRWCETCFPAGWKAYEPLGLPLHRFSQLVTRAEGHCAKQLASTIGRDEIAAYTFDGLAVGEHAMAGALRFFARGTLDEEPSGEAILRRYLHASLLTVFVTRRLLQQYDFASACFNHGIYVPQGLIGEVARQARVRVVNWNPAYRKHCFIFSHGDSYHHTLLDEPAANWETMPWSEAHEAEILDYLKSRWQGTRDWIWFHEKPREELSAIVQELGIDPHKPWIGMLTNVMWDAQLHYRANAFPNMLEWALETIRYFAARPELQLIIRIHPAEIRGTLVSRQPLWAELQKHFPQMPSNVFVISPESQISTYAVMAPCNAVIIYGTKTGVELTSMGIPVIVAGEAWIRNKGVTLDASSREEYLRLLDRLPLPERLDPATTQRARKYAYHFFFRRMIPLEMCKPQEGWPPYRLEVTSLDELKPGSSRGLDVICEGILTGSEFIYPAEALAAPVSSYG